MVALCRLELREREWDNVFFFSLMNRKKIAWNWKKFYGNDYDLYTNCFIAFEDEINNQNKVLQEGA